MKPSGKLFLSLAFIILPALQLFAQSANNNSSVKIEIKNYKYLVSGVVSSEAVKNEIVAKVSEISKNNAEFSGLKVNVNAPPFADGWQKNFEKSLFKSKLWKSGVSIFTTARSAQDYPNVPDEILNADIFLAGRDTPVRIADYRNKVVVLLLLASWCGPCLQQAGRMNEFYPSVSPDDVEIIAVSVDPDDKKNFQEFVKRLNFKYKIGMADEKLYTAALKISKFAGIPQVFLVSEGKLYGIFTGGSPQISEKLEETIQKLSKTR